MMKKAPLWIPLWVDKWLLGSTRCELSSAERAIFLDLLCLASKKNGIIEFGNGIGYKESQLAGLLMEEEALIHSTIEKSIKFGKLLRDKSGVLIIANWNEYRISLRYRQMLDKQAREQKSEEASRQGETIAQKSEINRDRERDRDRENRDIKPDAEASADAHDELIEDEFKKFWEWYPIHISKIDAKKAFKALRKKTSFTEITEALRGYANYLKKQRIKKNFDQTPMYPATFLRSERWRDFIGITYKPEL